MKKRPLTDAELRPLLRRVLYDREGPPALAVTYGRVSRKSQVAGTGLGIQDDDSDRWCQQRSVTIMERYVEPGESGRYDTRPEFQRMLKDLPQLVERGVRYVVIWSIDRFARDTLTHLREIDRFRRLGVALVSVCEPIDYSTANGKRQMTEEAASAQHYSDRLSERMQRTALANAENGRHNGPAPLGYRRAHERGPLEPTEHAEQQQMLFSLFATGLHSTATLAREMNALGYRVWNIQKAAWVPYSKWSVTEMLRNQTYIGKVRYKNQWMDGQHPAIIDQQTWDKVQTILERRGKKRGRTTIGGMGGALVEILHCAECGNRLWQQVKRQSLLYYECSGQWICECKASRVREDQVMPDVMALLHSISLPLDVQRRIIARAQELMAPAPDSAATPNDAEVNAQMERLIDLRVSGALTKEQFERRRTALELQRVVAPVAATAIPFDLGEAVLFLSDAARLVAEVPFAEQRLILQCLFSHLWASKTRGLVAYTPRAPYLELMAVATARPLVVGHGEPGGHPVTYPLQIPPPRRPAVLWTALNQPYSMPAQGL